MTLFEFQAALYATKCGRHLSKFSRVTTSRIKFEIRSVNGWNFEYDSINNIRALWPQKSPAKFKFPGKMKMKCSSNLKIFHTWCDLNNQKLICFLIFQESCELFTSLYRTWSHSPIATIALCLLTGCYRHAGKYLEHRDALDIN